MLETAARLFRERGFGLDTLVEVAPGKTRAQRRQRAAVTLAIMVGAIVLARAVDDEGPSNEILRVVKAAYTQPAEG